MKVRFHEQHLRCLCWLRGVNIETASRCVVEREGAMVVVDTEHPAYPKQYGPGTELSRLLKRFGIEPTPTCACRAKAAEMDAWGPDECSKPERIEEVVAVMREEAKARGLPFLDAVGRMLVRRAIHNARKASPPPARAETPIV